MNLEDLGYNINLEDYRKNQALDSFGVGRVILEHRDRYIVKTDTKELDSELIGSLRFSAKSRADLPAVGDWVALSEYDEDKALIHAVYPRKSVIERQAIGKFGEKQIIATNIDYGLIVQAVDRDFNINRLERYLTICYSSKVKPIIILSKTDLITESKLSSLLKSTSDRIQNVPIIRLNNMSESGYKEISTMIEKGKTYCLLGSSGVGKSTLLNNISGKEVMNTDTISGSSNRGRHITSHRELVILENGGILIDNPGMREVGIADAGSGLEITFNEIVDLALECRYKDCTHMHEKGCAIIEAVQRGEISIESYENYQKMQKEKTHFESSAEDKKKKDKELGKLIKNVKKIRYRNKY